MGVFSALNSLIRAKIQHRTILRFSLLRIFTIVATIDGWEVGNNENERYSILHMGVLHGIWMCGILYGDNRRRRETFHFSG